MNGHSNTQKGGVEGGREQASRPIFHGLSEEMGTLEAKVLSRPVASFQPVHLQQGHQARWRLPSDSGYVSFVLWPLILGDFMDP